MGDFKTRPLPVLDTENLWSLTLYRSTPLVFLNVLLPDWLINLEKVDSGISILAPTVEGLGTVEPLTAGKSFGF